MRRFGLVTFVDAPGRPVLEVEIASDHARGLQGRVALDPDHGMLFSWPTAEVRTFWMHETLIPLDVIFVDAADQIAVIWPNVPPLNDAPRSSIVPASHAIEVNAGYCRHLGIVVGQRVSIRT